MDQPSSATVRGVAPPAPPANEPPAPPQCPSRYPESPGAGIAPLACILDAGHTAPHRDGLGREWAPRVESDHDPLETRVSVAEDLATVSLWVDGYEVPLACDPGVAEAHVDILRRLQAACEHAIRLIRSRPARQAFAQGPGAPLPWLAVNRRSGGAGGARRDAQ